MSDGPYHFFPIRIFMPPAGHDEQETERTLLRSPFGFVEGAVEIGGKQTIVRFMFDPNKGSAYADWGWQGMDANADGRIQEGANSEEWTFANDETVVFHVNGRD